MWIRNLVFMGVVLGAAAGLSASLFPANGPGEAGRDGRRRSAPSAPPAPIAGEVDREFRRAWAEEGLKATPRADDLAVLRRLELALTGSIPSLEEIRRFESGPTAGRVERALEDLLRDRRYTDYFAERLARAYVGTEDGPFLIFRRRRFVTWLSDELMENRPYDQLVRSLIAGKGIWTDQPSTNFVTVTMDPETKVPDAERLAARSARAFLGIRLDCAQCHDHPFQPWKQGDFRGIAAFFGDVQTSFTGLRDDAGKKKFELTNRKTGKPEVVEPRVPFQPELWARDGNRREQFARWVTNPKNPHFPRATVNRVWALLFGRPLVEPVDDIPSAGEVPRVLDLLAGDFVARGYDLQHLLRVIVATEAFRLDSAGGDGGDEVSEARERAWAAFPMTRLRPEQVVGGLYQAASLATINRESPILVRLGRSIGQENFVRRYGDTGEDEFGGGAGTIPQRLLMMNGQIVEEKTRDSLFNAATRIGFLAPDDRRAVEIAYLIALTRRPTPPEAAHFEARLAGSTGKERTRRMTDLTWTLVNSTEFSWNH